MISDLRADIDGMFEFMTRTFPGNWQYRCGDTPYMLAAEQGGKRESIVGHVWACIGMWMQMRAICPALAALVDTDELNQIFWVHDLGETITGDVSSYQQLQGLGTDKHLLEHEEIRMLTDCLPKGIQENYLTVFDAFEQPLAEMTKLEYLVAKFIDIVEGNHFVLSYGVDLGSHSTAVAAILEKKLTPRTLRLLSVLQEGGHTAAYVEVRVLAKSHVELFQKAGVTYSIEGI